MNILIVEDDVFLAERIGDVFRSKVISNRVKIVHSYLSFSEQVPILSSYDIILTDLSLQGTHELAGYKILRLIREKGLIIPVIVMSGFNDLDRLREAFECGASDYIIKPIRLRELEIRILNWCKNYYLMTTKSVGSVHFYEELSYDISRNEFSFAGEQIPLTKSNKYLLSVFFSHPEKLLTESSLSERIWGDISLTVERNLRIHILRLKQALAPFGIDGWIQNIRGEGYIFSKK